MIEHSLNHLCMDVQQLHACDYQLELPCAHEEILGTGSGIHWRRWGQGPVLVLLHNWHSDWLEWQYNIGAFASNFQVWVPQLPCPKHRPSPQWQDMHPWAQALQCDLQLLCPNQSMSLLGNGWGSLLAAYAAPFMAQLSSLVLLGVGGHGSTPHLATPQPDLLLQHWQLLSAPTLLIDVAAQADPDPNHTAIILATGYEEREWMLMPNAHLLLQQTRALEINRILTHWLLSHI